MSKTYSFLVCLAYTLVCHGTSASAETLRTVALSDDSIFGTKDYVALRVFPLLNNSGKTAFGLWTSSLDENDVKREERSIWFEKDGDLNAVARDGDATAEGSDAIIHLGFAVTLNNKSQMSFLATNGLWLAETGRLALLDREHQTIPTGFGAFLPPAPIFNDAGQTAFSGAGRAIWIADENGVLASIALPGDPAPGTAVAFGSRGFFGSPVLNNFGQAAFRGGFMSTGTQATEAGIGVWKGGVDSLGLVARAGGQAPGTEEIFSAIDPFTNFADSKRPWLSFNNPAINDAGQTAFRAYLLGEEVNETNNEGVWAERGDSLALVARSGDLAPGTEQPFYGFDDFPILNSQGRTAFRASILDTNNEQNIGGGIWSEGGGTLALVARSGDPAPGTDSVFVFHSEGDRGRFQDFSFQDDIYFGSPVLNGAGQVAFSGRLSPNSQGIWAQDTEGILKLIAKVGDQIDVDDGPETDFRTIEHLRFSGGSGNQDGRSSGFNDQGQLVFWASFSDGTTGIFVSNLVAVPEPASLALFVVAGLVLSLRRSLRKKR